MTATFNFSQLSPDCILDALEAQGIFASSGLLALNSFENRVYQFLDDDRQRWVVKFYRPQRWSDAQIQEEHDFALELQDAEIPVIAPVALAGKTLHHHQGFRWALYRSVGGHGVELADLDRLEQLGHYLGRLHNVGARQAFASRPVLDAKSMLASSQAALADCELIPVDLQRPLQAILAPLCQRTDAAFRQHQASNIRLHGDCHAGNFLDGPAGLFMLDLDDALNGPAMQDLWMLLSGTTEEQTLQLEVLLEAYQQHRPLALSELRLIRPLQALRQVRYLSWLAQRWQDPAFPRAFPWFADGKYWEQQILTFKETLAALDEPPLQLSGGNR